MKITVYTIKDCTFSKQEKEYLNTNKLVFEEKDLETNKDFLTEMLAISNNFAGTPVTRVEKDDGTIAVLKGFTKEEFDTTFGLTPTPPTAGSENLSASLGTSPTPTTDSTVPSPVNDTPIPVTTPTETVTPAPIVETPESQPIEPTPTDSTDSTVSYPLKSIMDDLQAKAEPVMAEPTVPPVVETPPAVEQPPVPPVVNDQPVTPPADAPLIPDFPAK